MVCPGAHSAMMVMYLLHRAMRSSLNRAKSHDRASSCQLGHEAWVHAYSGVQGQERGTMSNHFKTLGESVGRIKLLIFKSTVIELDHSATEFGLSILNHSSIGVHFSTFNIIFATLASGMCVLITQSLGLSCHVWFYGSIHCHVMWSLFLEWHT